MAREWSPFEVGRKFHIKPDSFSKTKKGKINIILGRGLAFGSGEHETTRHCLEIMETLPFLPYHTVLDYGSGTGILAIAAAKLNATSIIALDIDFHAAISCQNNARLNHVDKNISIVCGDLMCIDQSIKFSTILANIYADLILENFIFLSNHLKKVGYFLISGIDWDYLYDVKRRFSRLNYQVVNEKTGDDYNSILYRKLFD